MIEATRAISRFTYALGAAGGPSMTVPCDFDREGLPISMQLVADGFDEARLFRAGHAFPRATDFHRQRPVRRRAGRRYRRCGPSGQLRRSVARWHGPACSGIIAWRPRSAVR